jgi:hypothetical protein
MAAQYRQGDVLLVAVPAIPKDARPLPRDRGRIVLALGRRPGTPTPSPTCRLR